MITVACVLRSGGIYTPEWVRRLRDGVARNLAAPHRFVCLSDVDVPCERIPLIEPWKGWWSKIALFRPGLFGDNTVFYFDLDTIVVGSLDAITEYPHRFTMTHEFYQPHLLCSTAMAWRGDWSKLYATFAVDADAIAARYDAVTEDHRIGDQAFIEDCFRDAGEHVDTFRDLFGERSIASYKVHECRDSPPRDAAVVSFHGYPKPHDLQRGWVPALWR